MCGIAGFQGHFDRHLLEAMGDALAHRGPDGSGSVVFEEGAGIRTGLAHRRLSIIDLSDEGRQPMTVGCPQCGAHSLTDLALTYNGEIYNYRELRRELQARGHVFHSATDSEVLLHLYADAGFDMLHRLNGIYAFAIRDGRTAGRPADVAPGDLFLARDSIGVKPLYHATVGDSFLFGSEIKALLHCADLSRELDYTALHQQLAYLWVPAPRTMLRAVRKLEPGHAMHVRGGSTKREWQFYNLPYGRSRLDEDEHTIAARVSQAVSTAVERQLVADVPVGAFLSGGLDSSAVVAMMRQARPEERPVCYSIGFMDGIDNDGSPADLAYARVVARHLDVDLREMHVESSIIGELERMLWFLDEPQADPAPINALLICEQARRDGLKVLLSGAGGDDIFSGYRRHAALGVDSLLRRVPQSLLRMAGNAARRAQASSVTARRLAKLLEHSNLDGDMRIISHFWWNHHALRESLLAPELRSGDAAEEAAAPLLTSLERISDVRDPLERMLYLEGRHFLPDHNLNYTDKMGMAAGVEVRVPLLDLDLVELATRISPACKQKGMQGKAIFKRSMEGLLPREVIYRPKTGFGAPLRHWFRHELRDLVQETLSERSITERGLFDPQGVQRLVELDRRGHVDGAFTILAIICTELWCRLFIDQPIARAAGVH